jgi:deoxyribose-phosphate aldolase
MTIEDNLNHTLKQITGSSVGITREHLISLIDYTCLNTAASIEDIESLAAKAVEHHVAAVCIYPQHLDILPKTFPILRATVVNFPTGEEPLPIVLESIERIKNQHQVDEIDYVFPYQTYLSGSDAIALSHCQAVSSLCKQHHLTFKVILETGAFSSLDMIHDLSLKVIQTGCDFLKTSTGKISQGASIPAAFAMLLAIQESQTTCGIKLSGGIKTVEQATAYVQLAQFMLNKTPHASWLRLGTSTFLTA